MSLYLGVLNFFHGVERDCRSILRGICRSFNRNECTGILAVPYLFRGDNEIWEWSFHHFKVSKGQYAYSSLFDEKHGKHITCPSEHVDAKNLFYLKFIRPHVRIGKACT